MKELLIGFYIIGGLITYFVMCYLREKDNDKKIKLSTILSWFLPDLLLCLAILWPMIVLVFIIEYLKSKSL